ncbi:hypothetical protein KIPB_009007, partial [Kipferlia bialata]|eukprot:g9007.t1
MSGKKERLALDRQVEDVMRKVESMEHAAPTHYSSGTNALQQQLTHTMRPRPNVGTQLSTPVPIQHIDRETRIRSQGTSALFRGPVQDRRKRHQEDASEKEKAMERIRAQKGP